MIQYIASVSAVNLHASFLDFFEFELFSTLELYSLHQLQFSHMNMDISKCVFAVSLKPSVTTLHSLRPHEARCCTTIKGVTHAFFTIL